MQEMAKKGRKENNLPDGDRMAKQADRQDTRTDKQGRPASDDLVLGRSYSWKQETRAGWAGRLVQPNCELAGWGRGAAGGWDGWDCGFWTPKMQPDSLPRRYSFQGWGRSPASKPLRVASAATKGELLGRGPPSPGPPSHLFGPASCSNRPGQPFLIGGQVL